MGCGIRPLPARSGHWAREMRLEPWGEGGRPLPTRLGLAIAGARPEGQGISTPLPDGAHRPGGFLLFQTRQIPPTPNA